MFKTRRDVEQFLSDRGIKAYNGIILTKKGFIVDSYEMLRLPLSHELAFELPSIKRLTKNVNSGCLTSTETKR